MNVQAIETKVRRLQSESGGSIFAFPIDDEDPLSKYAVSTLFGGEFVLFSEPMNIEDAANGIKSILDGAATEGLQLDYERDVRFTMYEAQMNAPSTTIRRAKKAVGFDSVSHAPLLEKGVDMMERDDGEEGYFFSGRGVVKMAYLEIFDDNPRGTEFMDRYYQLLATKRYGKTAAAIKREVKRMTKEEGIRWIERTYARHITDGTEVMNLMQSLR